MEFQRTSKSRACEQPGFDIVDTVGAWVPHGRFILAGAPSGPLAGLRFAVKDLFDVAGHPSGAGNPDWLASHPPANAHAPVVASLLAAGATLAGKVLTDELAYSLHGDNAHYGAPINTRAPDRVTGGSSSGSAAAVAAGLVDFALGTDTGGSTRVPASYCGLFGLRTTHGLLGTQGMIGLHPSFDTVTWLANDADVFSRVADVLLPASDFGARRALRLDDACALADADFIVPLREIHDRLSNRLALRCEPVVVADADAESLADWRQAYADLGAFEAWQRHGHWIDSRRPAFGEAIAARFRAASRVDANRADMARQACRRIAERVRALLGTDAIAVLPSAAGLAPRRDAEPAAIDSLRMRTMAITCIAGIAGLPQVSIPMPGAGPDAAPCGVSLLGPRGSDRALIALAMRLAAGNRDQRSGASASAREAPNWRV